MSTDIYCNLAAFLNNWRSNSKYFEMLQLMATISKLFSESTTPYLDYRLAENLFCKYFGAQNDARSCTSYDARLANLGIGIKTFCLNNGTSLEKIAEFNRLKPKLDLLSGHDLAMQIAIFRNERIAFSNNTYDVFETQYHIVGRQEGCLKVFNTSYDMVNIEDICDVKDKESSISFNDNINEYVFNKSKSVLLKRFYLPADYEKVPVAILENPLDLLALLSNELTSGKAIETHHNITPIISQTLLTEVKGYDYVILPLYSNRGVPHVPERSGLNQWNARGRDRNVNEVYIPIPKIIHRLYPTFFPARECPFELILPNGKSLSAKVCQDGGKALMSNPNAALGEWLLRKVLRKPVGEIVTIDDLNTYGIDSVKIISTHQTNIIGESVFKVVFTNSDYENYSEFIDE